MALMASLLGLACSFDSGSAGASGAGDSGDSTGRPGDPDTGAVTTVSESGGGTTTSTTDPSGTTTDGTSAGTSGSSEGSSGSASSSSTGVEGFVLCDEAEADLRACYDFAEVTEGALIDLSMYDNDGSVGPVALEAGPFGGAVRVGAEAEIAVPDSASLDVEGPASWEAWVFLDSVPISGRVGILDNDGQYSMMVYAGQGMRCNGGGLSVFANVPAGQWVHLACTHDGDTLAAWVDGLEVVSQPGGSAISTSSRDDMSLGDSSPGFVEPMDGLLGAVRVWSVVRTPEQIAEAAAMSR